MLLVFAAILLVSPRCSPAVAQGQAEAAKADTSVRFAGHRDDLRWYTMFANIPHDLVRFSRITFRPENIPVFIGLGVVTTALVATDDESWHLSDRWYNHSVMVRRGSDFFEYLGDGRPQFGLAAAFALYGFASSDRKALRTGSELVEGILSCGIVVQTLKHITGRQSPYVSTAPGGIWDFFPNQIDYHKHVPRYDAYPSGHIATAMATVTIVAENYPDWKWVRPVGYAAVGLIGVSMANTGIHWYSDFPLGIALGYCFGMIVSHPEGLPSETGSKGSSPAVTVAPVVGVRGSGLEIALSL